MKKDFKNAATVNSFIQNSPEKVLEAHVIKATIVQDSNESSEYDNEDEYDNELDEYDNENEEAEASEKSAEPEQSTKEKTSFDDNNDNTEKQIEVVEIDSFEVSDKSMRGIIDETYMTYKSILETMSLSMISTNNPMQAHQSKVKGLQYHLFNSTFDNLKILKQQQVLLEIINQLIENLESQKQQNDKTESID